MRKTTPTPQVYTDRKASSALVLSSLSFVTVIVFVLMFLLREKISKMDKRSVGRCFKWARKKVKKTRKVLSEKRKKKPEAKINVEVLDTSKQSKEQHLYATIDESRKAAKKKRSPSRASDDSDFSTSENAIDDNAVVAVELHAYQSVALESYKTPSMLEEVNLHAVTSVTYGSEKNMEHLVDQTTGCQIYDEIGDERKTTY
ncbi:uncharacterized protein LOC130696409 [Daphnia carinata]|uniref:uncharacterized protein LOC130696409 n=1 Tax=Daphnia carinata TaxID=120202 RepID=UPI00257B5150|nr:uncharacterized protein LOC130696409 [Daphnia carinata]